jgi:LuxR family transcriptional regulator, maltose regulon positive regulatory protein
MPRQRLIERLNAGVAASKLTPEAASYLNQVMSLNLTAEDVAALEARREGWIAALQLAALSMHRRNDASGFITGFTGNDRYIVDYLVEEVLQLQPEHVRRFLLQTSILDRLSGPLRDAVTRQRGGKSMLEALDDRRVWYRYHALFAEVVRSHLLDEQPDAAPQLGVSTRRAAVRLAHELNLS